MILSMRCPNCNAPVSAEEVRAGLCKFCGGAIRLDEGKPADTAAGSAAAHSPTSKPPTERENEITDALAAGFFSLVGIPIVAYYAGFLWAMGWTVLGAGLTCYCIYAPSKMQLSIRKFVGRVILWWVIVWGVMLLAGTGDPSVLRLMAPLLCPNGYRGSSIVTLNGDARLSCLVRAGSLPVDPVPVVLLSLIMAITAATIIVFVLSAFRSKPSSAVEDS